MAFDRIDVTSMVDKGRDVLAVMLGNGMYNVQRTSLPGVLPRGQRYTKFAASFGAPKLIAQLDVRYRRWIARDDRDGSGVEGKAWTGGLRLDIRRRGLRCAP